MRERHSLKWPQQIHRNIIWRCDLGHKPEKFTEEASFEKHMQIKHAECSPEEQDAMKVCCGIARTRRRNICPLCSFALSTSITNASKPDSEQKKLKEATEFQRLEDLTKHISGHLRRLAFDSSNNLNALTDSGSQGTIPTSRGRAPSGVRDLPLGGWSFMWLKVLSTLTKPFSGTFDPDWDFKQRRSLALREHRYFSVNPTSSIINASLRILHNLRPSAQEIFLNEDVDWSEVIAALKTKMNPDLRRELDANNDTNTLDVTLQHFR